MSSDEYRTDDPYLRSSLPPAAALQQQWPGPISYPVGPAAAGDQRLDPEATDATRYLCAAPHLDDKFAQLVLDEVLHQPRRAVAPSFGFSLAPVIRHCVSARRRTLARDGVVAGLLLLGLLLAFQVGVAVLLGFLGIWLLTHGVRLLLARQPVLGIVYLLLAAVLVPLIFVGLAAGIVALVVERVTGSYYYGYPGFDDSGPGAAAGIPLGVVWIFIVIGVWSTYFVHRLVVHHTIAVELTPQAYDPRRAPAASAAQERRLAYIEKAQRGNVTVYAEETSGHPFIGFGAVATEFSLVTTLQPAERPERDDRQAPGAGDPAALTFSVDELYESLRTGLAELSDDRLPRDEVVPHLSVHDRVFVAGRLATTSRYLEAGQPRSQLTTEERRELQHAERGRVRHYQTVRMSAWSGELEVTAFVHVGVRGRMLFFEFVATVVPGLRADYHRIDTYDRLDVTTILFAAGRSVGDLLRSPVAIARLGSAGWHALWRELSGSVNDRRISRRLAFDYGCRASVRELAADFDDPIRFQLYDADERVNLVQRRMLDVLVQFMDDHGYNVTDLAGQATTVINNSTHITNSNSFTDSTIVDSSIAAGNHARAGAGGRVSREPAPAPAAAGRPVPKGRI